MERKQNEAQTEKKPGTGREGASRYAEMNHCIEEISNRRKKSCDRRTAIAPFQTCQQIQRSVSTKEMVVAVRGDAVASNHYVGPRSPLPRHTQFASAPRS